MKKFLIILLFALLFSFNCLAKPYPHGVFKFQPPYRFSENIVYSLYFHEVSIHKRHLLFEISIPF